MFKYNYVYLSTNKINGKQYIGDHSTNNLNDGYLGSGDYFKRAIKKYGKENFERKILEFFNTKEEAFNSQEKWICKYNTLSPIGYNISPKGGHNVKNCISEETRIKISNSLKGRRIDREVVERIRLKNKGQSRKSLFENWVIKYGEEEAIKKYNIYKTNMKKSLIGKNLGNKLSEEAKLKISQSSKGIKKISQEQRKKISIKLKGKKKNIKKVKCPYCGKEGGGGNMTRYHFDNCKRNN